MVFCSEPTDHDRPLLLAGTERPAGYHYAGITAVFVNEIGHFLRISTLSGFGVNVAMPVAKMPSTAFSTLKINDGLMKLHQIEGYIQSIYLAEYPHKLLLLDGACRADVETISYFITGSLKRPLSHLKLVVSTHMHPDHAGAAEILRKKTACDIASADVLLIDDWGLEQLTQAQKNDMLEIMEDRHNCKSTLITSQLPLSKWHECINDPTLADAILDRLLHNAHRLTLKGESMRKVLNTLTEDDQLQ